MTNIEMILRIMSTELNDQQLAKLKNVLNTILRTNRTALPNNELIERFVQNKRLVGVKETTLRSYLSEIYGMRSYINKNFTEFTTSDIKDYLNYLVQTRHIQASTLQTRVHCITSFFDYLVSDEFIDKNPADKIERIIVEKKIKKAFTDEELNLIRNECSNLRDRAIVEFLYSTGTRINEAVSLNVKDINFSSAEVVVFGKGHKERVVYLSDLCMKILHEYLDSRFAQPDEPLFTSLSSNKQRITSRSVEVILREIGRSCGVDNVHPHRFRRTMATHLLDKGMPIEQIKEVLGHSRIDTTMIYCNVNSEKVKASFQDCFNDDDMY